MSSAFFHRKPITPQRSCWRERMMAHGFRALLILCSCLFLSACEEEAEKIKELEKEVTLLQSSLRDLKDRIQSESERTDDFTHRIETTEQQSTDALEQASNAVVKQGDRFKRMEKGMAQISKAQQQRESMAYLKVGNLGHLAIRTGHGTFLVILSKVAPIPGGGTRATLKIGNPLGLTVSQFDLKGDFGANAPELKPNEPYEIFSQRLDNWQKELTPFQNTFTQELKPKTWSELTLDLPIANSDAPLKLIRLTMTIKQAFLGEKQDLTKFTITRIDSKAAILLKSPYGAFLLAIDSYERHEHGMLVRARIGNPLAYTIAASELSGWYGTDPPTRLPSESSSDYSLRFTTWNHNLKPFKAPILTRIKPQLWTPITFILPADESHLKHLRMEFKISRISLSQERTR
ncbi:MAG: hypothetical protein L3J39_19235 [Verrucomicrobiales bacterium]|nr:hypothetical protein [Verrucomicrobiales bacterium]